MSKIDLVISIDEDVYKDIKSHIGMSYAIENYLHDIEWAIRNGTPLPKGHGRLIDADKLLDCRYSETEQEVSAAPTIIEADKCQDDCEHCDWVTCPIDEDKENE